MATQRIRILDEITINQIAAGEVIENPASVVKELVENALDSGSSSITVETKAGGRALIRVSDQGCGMAADDLVLALERHATSKLAQFDDLNTLLSLGFRGEALPSIAAVSKVCIHSADADEKGHLLHAEGGRIVKMQLLPRRRGTTVEVKSLFFNVPARKKFQKSIGWDTAEIHKVLTKMALCYKHVAFCWISDEEKQFSIPEEMPLQERIHVLLGESFAQSMLPVEFYDEPYSLAGFCSHVSSHRSNRTGQYLFINGRVVISPYVSQRILAGYGTRLSSHRYPLFVLDLALPSSLIDVNVHPQKKEVRLREEERLAPFFVRAVERCLGCTETLPSISIPQFVVNEQLTEYQLPSSVKQEKNVPQLWAPRWHIVGKVGKYLLAEDADGIHVIDTAAARFRIAYEQLMKKERKQITIQQLLLPVQIETSGAEKTALLANLSIFEDYGFSMRLFGENTFIVDAIPAIFEREEVLSFIYVFLDERDMPKEKKMMAALRKTPTLYSNTADSWLLETLFQCNEPDYTPEGKPTHYLLTEKELGRLK